MAVSPLGKYAQPVAAITAVAIIGSAIVLRAMGQSDAFLDNIALIALGAVFGSAGTTAVNGNAINAAHNRLDQLGAPPSKNREG